MTKNENTSNATLAPATTKGEPEATEPAMTDAGVADAAFSLVDNIQSQIASPDALTVQQKRFLASYVETLSVTDAAKAANQSRNAHYLNCQRNETYNEVFKQIEAVAMRIRLDRWLEDADQGQERFKFDRNGEPLIHPETGQPYSERVTDTIMRIFLMKSRMGLSDQPAPRSNTGQGVTVNVIMPGNIAPHEAINIEFDQPEASDNPPTDRRSLAHNPQDDSTNGVSENE